MFFVNSMLLSFLILTAGIHAQEVDLKFYEKRLISQNGEDGVIEKIFKVIGITNKYYVEFGAGDGHFGSNTKYLREKHQWKGLLLDGFYSENPSINLHNEFITAENIAELFRKYEVPADFDLISIDIDRNDFYVWKELNRFYKPRVVIIECNPCFNVDEDKVIRYSANDVWDGGQHRGASVLALFNLGRTLGYSLVYQDSNAVNLFFIRDDVLPTCNGTFKNINNVGELYVAQSEYELDQKIVNEKFISSEEALRRFQ